MLQTISLTWSATPPPGTKTVEGKWWAADAKAPQVAVAKRQADRLGVKVGSTITFAAQDKQIEATVAALIEADGQHAFSRAEFHPA